MNNTDGSEHRGSAGGALAAQEALAMPTLALCESTAPLGGLRPQGQNFGNIWSAVLSLKKNVAIYITMFFKEVYTDPWI